MTDIAVEPDAPAAAHHAAERVAAVIRGALAERAAAHVALAGGSTPRAVYELLGPLLTDWRGVELWLGDERLVAADDPESNARMVRESLIAAAGDVDDVQLHTVATELEPAAAAAAYAEDLRAWVPLDRDGDPILDLVLLGVGEDGHTASLFPGHEHGAPGQVTLVVWDAPKPPAERVSLTLPVLRAARSVLVLATGEGKAEPVAAMLGSPEGGTSAVPVAGVLGPQTALVLDRAAASGLAPGIVPIA